MNRATSRAIAVTLLGAAWGSWAGAKPPAGIRVLPVCGNTENGIAVGKPRLFDERTIALKLNAIESRLELLRSGRPRPYRAASSLPEEIDLTYQLLNFRSLADRALSDRVLLEPARAGTVPSARAQVLVSFQISIDPQIRYKPAIAEVEIAVSSHDSHQPPTVVSLLPKDKTYNVATLAKPGGSYGNAVLEAGATPDGQEKFTFAKDSDTVALERLTASREIIKGCATGFHESLRDAVLAWQFRPVLGRERVDAGTREVFALLALPTAAGEDYAADVHVHTHWRALKPQKSNEAVGYIEESARDEWWENAIRFNSSEMEQSLRPRIVSARFVPGGKEGFLVVADGQNFLEDTSVMLGKTTFSGSDLRIVRQRELQFTAPAGDLAEHDIFVAGRFGLPSPLVEPRVLSEDVTVDPSWGLRIESAKAHPGDGGMSDLRLKLKSRLGKKPLAEWIVNKTLVSVAGRVEVVTSAAADPTDGDAIVVHVEAPTAAIRQASRVLVARVFGGELYRDTAELVLEDDISASNVTLLKANGEDVTLAITGSGFSNLAEVEIACQRFTQWTSPGVTVEGPSAITLQTTRTLLRGSRQLILRQGSAKPLILPLPELPLEPSRAKTHKAVVAGGRR